MTPLPVDPNLTHQLQAIGLLRVEIDRLLPRASRRDRMAWRRLQPELREVQRMAEGTRADSTRPLLDETLDVLLRFRASLHAGRDDDN